MANKKDITGWYAELLWIEGFMGGILDNDGWEIDESIQEEIKYCQKRLKRLKLTMLKEGMKNVSERQIISTFSARAPSTFRFVSESERQGTRGVDFGDSES